MAQNVNIIGKDSEGNLRALKVNSEGNLEISDSSGWGESLQDISDKLDILVDKLESGDQKVQLSGTIIEVETLVDAQAIADTEYRAVQIPNRTQYASWDIEIVTTLDKPVRFGAGGGVGINYRAFSKGGDTFIFNIAGGLGHVYAWVDAGARQVFLSAMPLLSQGEAQELVDPLFWQQHVSNTYLQYKAEEAPTSGSLTIKFVGRLR